MPLAWTPLGVTVGTGRQDVGIPAEEIVEWADRTFPADDEHAFIASMRDLELLLRIGWDSAFSENLDASNVLNIDDLPDELAKAMTEPRATLVQCAACRRLCVRDDFLWKEKQLCAWDFHAQVFGKRGPWRQGHYEARHFETLPGCAYVAPELVRTLGVEVLLTMGALAEPTTQTIVNALIESEPGRAHMAVRTVAGVALLRETLT